jgi:hypothetical protein
MNLCTYFMSIYPSVATKKWESDGTFSGKYSVAIL